MKLASSSTSMRACIVMPLLSAAFLWVAREAKPQDDVAGIPSQDLRAGNDRNKRYFLIGPKQGEKPPRQGFGLVLVMPGGDGGPDFHPFVKRIYQQVLHQDYLVAQLVAVKWSPRQRIIWPTRTNRAPQMEFSTEQFVEAVIKDVRAKHRLNDRRIFTLSWSSGGPAAYAISLQEKKSVTGSYIAMSVFKPDRLPPLENARGHAYCLDHSPDDRICPFRMAEDAHRVLVGNGATVKLLTYPGGHGWRGKIWDRMRQGFQWLGDRTRQTKQKEGKGGRTVFPGLTTVGLVRTPRSGKESWALLLSMSPSKCGLYFVAGGNCLLARGSGEQPEVNG